MTETVSSDVRETGDEVEAEPVRPWARYCAKMSDFFIFAIPFMALMFLLGIAIAIVVDAQNDPALENLIYGTGTASNLVWGILAWVILIILFPIYEASLISGFGSTPGKSLMGIRLRTADGGKPSFSQAYGRSLGAYVLGQGAGIPVANLIAMIIAYTRLTADGVTSWDRGAELVYETRPVNFLRWTLGIILVLGNIALNLVDRLLANI